MRMCEDEIERVVMALAGDIKPIAETHYDNEVKENVEVLGKVARALICNIGCMAEDNCDSPYGSVEDVSNIGIRILEDIGFTIECYLKGIERIKKENKNG